MQIFEEMQVASQTFGEEIILIIPSHLQTQDLFHFVSEVILTTFHPQIEFLKVSILTSVQAL